MTSADIAVQSSNYEGNAALGGGGLGVIHIDTKPLEQLAYYTMTYNKAEYDQRQKDVQAKAKELADITAYDLNTDIKKDSDEIRKKWNDFYDYVQKNPTVLDYKNNEDGWLKFNRMKGEFENTLTSAKSRNILYKVRQEEIANEPDANMKAYLQKQLEDEVKATDINTPLKHTQQFDVAPVALTAPKIKEFDVTAIGGNFNITRDYKMPDMADVNSQAVLKAMGIGHLVVDTESEDFKSKSPEEQQLLLKQFDAQKASKKLEPVESSKIVSEIISKYKNEDGTIDIDKLKRENGKNALLMGTLSTIEAYNSRMDEMVKAIKGGAFQDRTGKLLMFGANGLNENDYRKIDLSDGVSPDELLKMRILGLGDSTKYKTKVDQTNLSLNQYKAAIDAGQLHETIRHNKATENLNRDELKQKQEQWKASQTGTETQLNGAMERAKRIYGDMLKLADKNGVITPDKVRQLNAEQLKYLGIEQVVTTDGGVPHSIFKPLDLAGDDNSTYAIQLVNGEVKVLKDAKPSPTGSGSYFGQFDNTKSTNLFNIGTNILNEELQKAGSKELNTYWGVDVSGGSTQQTQTKTSTTEKTINQDNIKLNKKGLPIF